MIFSRKSFLHFEVLKKKKEKKKDQEWALENSVCCEEIVATLMLAGGRFMHELTWFPSYDVNSPGRMVTSSACVMSTRKGTNVY